MASPVEVVVDTSSGTTLGASGGASLVNAVIGTTPGATGDTSLVDAAVGATPAASGDASLVDGVVGTAPRATSDVSLVNVVVGVTPAASSDASLVVRVARHADLAGRASAHEASIGVAVADPALTEALTAAVAEAIRAAALDREPPGLAPPTVRLRSRKRLARTAGQLAGALAIVPVTARNARHLVELVDGIRAAGALGIQLVWDGALPPRAQVEHHVFAALEHARATPSEPPVVLATSEPPAPALHLLVAHRSITRRATIMRRDEPR